MIFHFDWGEILGVLGYIYQLIWDMGEYESVWVRELKGKNFK